MIFIGGLFLSVLMQCTSMTVNQAFLTNLYSGGHVDPYSGGLQKFDGHNFFQIVSLQMS